MPSSALSAAPSEMLRGLQQRKRPQRPMNLRVAPADGGPHGEESASPPSIDVQDQAAEDEFARAMKEYRQRSGRMFPTWCEVLEVLLGLGYRKSIG